VPRQAPSGKAGKLRNSRSRKARETGTQNVLRGGAGIACRGHSASADVTTLARTFEIKDTRRNRKTRERVVRECYSRNAIRLSLKPLRYVVGPLSASREATRWTAPIKMKD
jgi:hypothetical protein